MTKIIINFAYAGYESVDTATIGAAKEIMKEVVSDLGGKAHIKNYNRDDVSGQLVCTGTNLTKYAILYALKMYSEPGYDSTAIEEFEFD